MSATLSEIRTARFAYRKRVNVVATALALDPMGNSPPGTGWLVHRNPDANDSAAQ